MHQGCLKVIRRSAVGDTLIGESCVESTASTILVNIGSNTNEKTYIGWGYLKFDNEITTNTKEVKYPPLLAIYEKANGRNIGLFVSYLLIVALSLAGIWHPVISVGFTLLGLFSTAMLELWEISTIWLYGLIILGLIIIFKLKQ